MTKKAQNVSSLADFSNFKKFFYILFIYFLKILIVKFPFWKIIRLPYIL